MDAHEQILDYPVLIANEASLATLMAELSSEGHAVDNVVVVEGKVIIASLLTIFLASVFPN